jgi:hypothetical protein
MRWREKVRPATKMTLIKFYNVHPNNRYPNIGRN